MHFSCCAPEHNFGKYLAGQASNLQQKIL